MGWPNKTTDSGEGRRCLWRWLLLSGTLLLVPRAANALPITFETVTDTIGVGVEVDTQFASRGVLFSNTLALTAGLSLNEIEFPPHSGDTAVGDSSGPMVIDFTAPFFYVQAFFTYHTPITLQAFDATGVLLRQVTSAFSSNIADPFFADPGSSPNELLRLDSLTPIARLVITGDPSGGSFVLDDFDAGATAAVPVPEPTSMLLLLSGLGLAMRRRICYWRQP